MIQTLSPIDNTVCFSTTQLSDNIIDSKINIALSAQTVWSDTSLENRISIFVLECIL